MAKNPRPRTRGRKRFVARLRTYFLTGLLVAGPAAITLYVGWLIVGFIDTQVSALIPTAYNPKTYLPGVPGVGVAILILFLILVGWTTATVAGRMAIGFGEGVLNRTPVVRSVYGAVKQIMETILTTNSNAFRQVVLLEYPRRGVWCIGFVSGATTGEVQNVTMRRHVNVFVPTTPNPTSGFLLFVPEDDLHVLDMTIEEGVKMVVSGGLVTPPDRRPAEQRDAPAIA